MKKHFEFKRMDSDGRKKRGQFYYLFPCIQWHSFMGERPNIGEKKQYSVYFLWLWGGFSVSLVY